MGLSVARTAEGLCILNCSCEHRQDAETCESCRRNEEVKQSLAVNGSYDLSDEEILETLKWLSVEHVLRAARLGAETDLEVTDRFERLKWNSLNEVFILRRDLQPYLLPGTMVKQAYRRLIGRLQRMVSFPHDFDDADKSASAPSSSIE